MASKTGKQLLRISPLIVALLVTGLTACARVHSATRSRHEADDDPWQIPGEEAANGEGELDESSADGDFTEPDASMLEEPDASRSELCDTRGGITCADGEYCRKGPDCGQTDLGGYCEAIPEGCERVWDPVCGCDGNTYANEGCAAAAGQSVTHASPCEHDGIEFCDLCDVPDEMPPPLPCPDGTAEFACIITAADTCTWQRLPCPPCDDRPLEEGECWNHDQCLLGTCMGASCCGPFGVCPEADTPGRCQ